MCVVTHTHKHSAPRGDFRAEVIKGIETVAGGNSLEA